MYVYPLSLAFDTQKNIPRARNITCMVQLFDSDNIDSKPIKVISYLNISLKLVWKKNLNVDSKYCSVSMGHMANYWVLCVLMSYTILQTQFGMMKSK